MPDRFKHFCPSDDTVIEEAWDHGTFIFDTNIFLNIYRLPEDSRKNLLNILNSNEILKRIWIPFQVALEFHERRLTIIRNQIKIKDDLVSIIKLKIEEINKKFNKQHKYHPFIDKSHWQERLSKLKNNLIDELEELASSYPMSLTEDPLLESIRAIIKSRIGDDFDENEINEICKEAEVRFKNTIPPGCCDSKFEGNINKYGDFIIWKQLILEMKKRKTHAIFVTDDIKDDWWLRQGGMLIGGRPELRKEFYAETGYEIIFYTMERFLKRANEIIKKPIKKNELDNLIKKSIIILRTQRELLAHQGTKDEELSLAAKAMVKWFFDNYEDPANGVPYESAEGGYQYIFGGPYYARDELEQKFPEANEEDIEEAVDYIEPFGWEWVKVGEY